MEVKKPTLPFLAELLKVTSNVKSGLDRNPNRYQRDHRDFCPLCGNVMMWWDENGFKFNLGEYIEHGYNSFKWKDRDGIVRTYWDVYHHAYGEAREKFRIYQHIQRAKTRGWISGQYVNVSHH